MTARMRATWIGSLAILIWAPLTLCSTIVVNIPAFQLEALAFGLASLISIIFWLKRGDNILLRLKQPIGAWGLSVFGLFGYHFLYFMALRMAPPLEVVMIIGVWPLAMALLSSFLTKEQLGGAYLAGTFAALFGAGLLVSKGQALSFDLSSFGGYALAFACMLVWSLYSVLNRYYKDVPTDAVGGFCMATSFLALICHLMLEDWIDPTLTEWVVIAIIGLGPMGIVFYIWDYGSKHGNVRLLGLFCFAIPLLSSACLILAGYSDFTPLVVVSAFLIVGGACIGSGAVRLKWSEKSSAKDRKNLTDFGNRAG